MRGGLPNTQISSHIREWQAVIRIRRHILGGGPSYGSAGSDVRTPSALKGFWDLKVPKPVEYAGQSTARL